MKKKGLTKKDICRAHKPHGLGYMQWYTWIENKIKNKEKQYKCQICGRWLFFEEI